MGHFASDKESARTVRSFTLRELATERGWSEEKMVALGAKAVAEKLYRDLYAESGKPGETVPPEGLNASTDD